MARVGLQRHKKSEHFLSTVSHPPPPNLKYQYCCLLVFSIGGGETTQLASPKYAPAPTYHRLHYDLRGVVGVSGAVRGGGATGYRETPGLLPVGATDSFITTQTENTKHFD